jgi:hypothetical protein
MPNYVVGSASVRFEPYTVVPGLDTIAVPAFDIDLLGHTYYAQAAALLHDMYDLMHSNTEPSRRQRIAAMHHEGQEFWRLLR